MYGNLDISVSGMVAQRTRLETIAANIANVESILDPNGDPNAFRRRIAILMPGDPAANSQAGRSQGVHISEIMLDQSDFEKKYQPDSPYAQPEGSPDAGYVYYPNINLETEQVSAVEAMRAYEANVVAAEASKTITAQALRMIA